MNVKPARKFILRCDSGLLVFNYICTVSWSTCIICESTVNIVVSSHSVLAPLTCASKSGVDSSCVSVQRLISRCRFGKTTVKQYNDTNDFGALFPLLLRLIFSGMVASASALYRCHD